MPPGPRPRKIGPHAPRPRPTIAPGCTIEALPLPQHGPALDRPAAGNRCVFSLTCAFSRAYRTTKHSSGGGLWCSVCTPTQIPGPNDSLTQGYGSYYTLARMGRVLCSYWDGWLQCLNQQHSRQLLLKPGRPLASRQHAPNDAPTTTSNTQTAIPPVETAKSFRQRGTLWPSRLYYSSTYSQSAAHAGIWRVVLADQPAPKSVTAPVGSTDLGILVPRRDPVSGLVAISPPGPWQVPLAGWRYMPPGPYPLNRPGHISPLGLAQMPPYPGPTHLRIFT